MATYAVNDMRPNNDKLCNTFTKITILFYRILKTNKNV